MMRRKDEMRKPFAVGLFIVVALLVSVLLGIRALVWWSHSVPTRPASVSADAVWIPGPPVPFELTRRGNWLECRTEGLLNRCIVSGADGAKVYDGLFSPKEGAAPVPDERLRYGATNTGDLWTWLNVANRNVPVIRLKDGTVLLPTEGYQELKAWLDKLSKQKS
jgi:hypothetical protein